MTRKKKTAVADLQISFTDFVAFREMHNFIFLPTRAPWPAASVDAQLPPMALLDDNGKAVLGKGKPKVDKQGKKIRYKNGKPNLEKGEPKFIPAHRWLDKHRPVHQMCWSPAEPELILDKVLAEGGWIAKPGTICLNLYRPPTLKLGDARKAGPWIDHVHKVYPGDADHIIKWLAHRKQFPGDKINHALLLGGAQGIGKDTLLEPVTHAIGPWNFAEVTPAQTLGPFNGYVKSVILRISEARDLGDTDRFKFYDHCKPFAAAPPATHRCNQKFLPEHYVLNCCGMVITTNYLSDGVYLPADDRRHYVAWSELTKEDFSKEYWNKLWRWYGQGGIGHVAAYLAELDLSKFDAKAPPPKTAAFYRIVDANRAPEEGELSDAIEQLGFPDALTIDQVVDKADKEFREWLRDRRNRRVIPHRFETAGYVAVKNNDAKSGLWRIDKVRNGWVGGNILPLSIESERQMIYVKSALPIRDQHAAANRFLADATARAKDAVAEAAAGKKPKAAAAK